MILLSRPYAGYAAGTIVELPASTEAALIASGGATASSAAPTANGSISTTALQGCAGVPAGFVSFRITNPAIAPQTILYAMVAQAAADATALRVERIICAAGFADVYMTAAATATTQVDWAIMNPLGSLSSPQ